MKIEPGMISDEVVAMAIAAIRAEELRSMGGYKTPDNGARQQAVRLGLAAAMNVMLGEPVAWLEWDGSSVAYSTYPQAKTLPHGKYELFALNNGEKRV